MKRGSRDEGTKKGIKDFAKSSDRQRRNKSKKLAAIVVAGF